MIWFLSPYFVYGFLTKKLTETRSTNNKFFCCELLVIRSNQISKINPCPNSYFTDSFPCSLTACRNWMAWQNKNGQIWILASRPQIPDSISSLFRPNSYNKLVHYNETYGNKMLFIFALKIRVILQKVNKMALEICSSTF